MTEREHQARQVAIVPEGDDQGAFPLAQNLFANHDEHHIYLRFLQVVPPIILDGIPPDAVTGRLVASVSVPATLIPTLVRLFEDLGRKYEVATGHALDWAEQEGKA